MPLNSVKFLITTSYGSLSMAAYLTVGYILLKYRSRFPGSFFKLYLAQSVFNCVTYLNTMVTLRLPQNTCADCFLAPFFNQTHFWGLEIFHTIHFHMGYVQYFMITVVSANRLSMMLFPFNFEKYWRKTTVPVVIFVAFSPLLATSTIFLNQSAYYYVELMDCYATRNSTDMGRFYKILIVFMVTVTLISVVLNGWTVVLLFLIRRRNNEQGTKKSEITLVIHSFLNFVIMFTACVITVFNLYGVTDTNRDTWYAQAGQLFLPFVSDTLTLLSPFLLIACCSSLRAILFGHISLYTPKSSVVVVPTTTIRRGTAFQ